MFKAGTSIASFGDPRGYGGSASAGEGLGVLNELGVYGEGGFEVDRSEG